MSLINEALKKAQRQRSLETAPLSSAPSGIAAAAVTTHVRAASHKRSLAPLWFGLGILSLGAGATALVMRYGFGGGSAPTASSYPAPMPVTPAPVSTAPATPIASTPVTAPAAVLVDAPVIVLPPLSGNAPAPKPAQTETLTEVQTTSQARQTPAPAPSPATASPLPAASATATVAPVAAAQVASAAPSTKVAPIAALASVGVDDRETKIQTFLNNARITGVRGGDKDARLLMNERVWRPGDTVAPEFGLRLQAVRAGRIIFSDTQGRTFEKAY